VTPEQKAWIDAATYRDLLQRHRFGLLGDPIFLDECGAYFYDVMRSKRGSDAEHVAASKFIGW